MSLINVCNLTFSYDGNYKNIFENVSFKIDTDWKLGFTGRNGVGKTTFFKLLLGKYEYLGNISASVEFDYFPFYIRDKTHNTIDIAEMIYPDYEFWELCKELSLMQISCDILYRPFDSLSFGEQTKVMLVILFLKKNNFLLIDEPTNHLDIYGRKALSEYLKKKKGFIVISHDRNFLDNCIDHILYINNTNIEIQQGNFSSWTDNKKRQDKFEISENEKLKKEIKRLASSAKSTSYWSEAVEKTKKGKKCAGLKPDRGFIGHKSAKMMKRSKSIERRKKNAVENKSKLLKNIQTAEKIKIKALDYYAERLIEAVNLSLFYGDNLICENVNFTLFKGDRAAIVGKNGCGKSSLLKLLNGESIRYEGGLNISGNMKISYISQNTDFLEGRLSGFAEKHFLDSNLFRTILSKLDFSVDEFDTNIENLSDGQKKKVLIAKSLCEPAHLFIWDEPLNFIDVLSRQQIESMILECKPTMLFVEHDKDFIEKVADNIIEIG